MSKYKSEAGHWYDHDGEPMYTIIGANGKERNTTLRDAKSIGLVPSVTTILGLVSKPSLENWKITQALQASLNVDNDDPEYINKCKNAGREVGMKAAKQGTKIHAQIKTKDNLEGKDPSRLVYDEHGMQLSAYAQGCNIEEPERVSIFIDRADTTLVLPHIWENETHYKHKEMFNSLLNYWKLVKNYDSTIL